MHRVQDGTQGATLYVVATPIGNLRDVTLRALDVLKSVDAIAAEDTRIAGRLLAHYGISTRTFAIHEHNEREAAEKLLRMLAEGRCVALVTDAGTPGLSDPGALAVSRVRAAGFRVIPIPGPSALAAAISISGIAAGRFLFCGFLPAKSSERRSALEQLSHFAHPMVFFEAPHRIAETMTDMQRAFGDERGILIARELTKVFEEVQACTLGEAPAWLAAKPQRLKGEFVLLVHGCEGKDVAHRQSEERVLRLLLAELPVKQAVRLATQITGGKRNLLYRRALEADREIRGNKGGD
ncbi:MAG TPA: 16S rRNA (cytidine(1402)-2'-O)-methyltransferase [Burkholderiales bacterium]|nr:16S rRNA (cytidine(1402)-2'-O)-methyltransferase [Burkholderiales bacterium]